MSRLLARCLRAAAIALAVAVSATATAGPSASTGGGASASPAPQGDLPEALRAKLQEALDQIMATYDVPGAAVGVWVPGKGAWIAAAGIADRATGAPVTKDMTWPLRSVTKSYTVTLILQLAGEGRLSLDDPIDKYVSGVTGGGAITLRELAAMSSGNADYVGEEFIKDFEADPNRIFTLEELNSYALGKPANFAPGTRRIYTNANTNLLGAVVERVTGKDFKDALSERILEPLGLKNTHYLTDAREWPEPHAIGYEPVDGVLTPQPANLSIYGPAGSMVSNLDDERVWAEALATGSLLRQAMQSARLKGAPLEEGPPYDRYALGIGETFGWWGHNGEGFGFTAAMFHNDSTGATVVVFMNEAKAVPEGHPADQMFRRVATILKDY
ncbi:MAG: serine hydrolase domain-containing protein [Methyloceanibacter sp.]